MKKSLKVFLSAILSLTVFFTASGFAYYEGIGNVYYDASKQIFPETYYYEQIGANVHGNQHAYFISTNLDKNSLIPIVYSNGISNAETVGTMASNLRNMGYQVLAGINGDIFDTLSKAPKGFTMHDGNILSSGYASEKVLVFDRENKASLQPSSVSFTLKGEIAFKYEAPVVENTESVENTGNTENIGNVLTEPNVIKTELVRTKISKPIGFVNVPHGGAKALHLFNRNYAYSTKTIGKCIEVVIDCGNPYNTQLRVGNTIKGTVKEVYKDARNTPIGENEIVLSTQADSATSGVLQTLVLGTEVEIETSSNGNVAFDNAKEALGVYYTILENGNFVTPGTNLNPRTALGIKADGSIVLYVLDGRSYNAKGLGLTELAKHMKSMGCIHVANLDGGGSSTFYARLPGKEDTAKRRNNPPGKERKVSNGFFLVYKNKGDSEISNLAVYPSQALLMPKAVVKLNTMGLNSNFETVARDLNPVYNLLDDNGNIDYDGYYTAGEKGGVVRISARKDDAYAETKVTVVRNGLTIKPNLSSLKIKPKESKEIKMSVMQGSVNVISVPKSFEFSCDENIGSIDEYGIFTAVDKQFEKGNIYVKFDSYSITIPVQVGEEQSNFTDVSGHWAENEIKDLVNKGLLNGIGNNMFNPNGEVTRAQFAAILAKLSSDDISIAPKVYFKDISEDAWYVNYIYWAVDQGVMKGVGENEIAPNAYITREQMCVMLCNYAVLKGIQIPQLKENVNFNDKHLISTWAIDYVNTIAGGAIVNGTPEGNFVPKGSATRAESAKIIYNYLKAVQ